MRLSVRSVTLLCGAVVLAAAAMAEDAITPLLGELTRSAALGNARAQYELGVAYANGEGVATDYAEAAHWFGEAAHNGSVEARRQLSFMVQIGLAPSSADPTDASAVRVQVASVASEADGAREWRRLQRLHPETLGPLTLAVEPFDSPNGDRLFRVEGGPIDEVAARDICGKLRAEGAGCRIVRPAP